MAERKRQSRRQVKAENSQAVTKPVLAKFDIAQTTRENRNHWANADALSARASISPAVRRVVRMRSRYEAENNSWYAGILRTAVNHIVGNGPRLQVLTDNPDANRRVERAFANWAKRVQFAEMLRTMVEAYWRDGESFAMRSERPRNFPFTLDLRMFETEQVASPLTGSILSNQYVDDGVRFDAATNEIEFHILDHHPGGSFPMMTMGGRWYPARDVLHLYRAERPGQTRGLPRATPALPLLPIMRRQQLATLYSAETAANFAMYLKSNSAAIDPTQSPVDFAEIEMARNMLTTLPAGWDLGQVEPRQPGPQYEMFQDHTLKSFGRCTNMPFPLLAGTAEKSNFSSFKGDMRNVWRPEVMTEQNRVEDAIVEPVFGWFLEQAALVPGVLDGMPPISEIDHKWHWPPLPDIDPLDTATTGALEVATGQKTLTQLHAERQQDWESEAARAARDFGCSVEEYKAAVFLKTFGMLPGQVPQPAGQRFGQPGQQAQRGGQQAADVPTGEYTQLGQRAFTNNLKRIRQTLDALVSGDMGRVMAEQTLLSIGLSPERVKALIDDAMDGTIDDPQLAEVDS